jgi:hypothetical protein
VQAEQQWHIPAGGSDYIEVSTQHRGRDLSWSGQLFNRQDESGVTADEDVQRFRDLFDGVYDSARDAYDADVLCARDPRGGKHFVRFNGNPTITYEKGGDGGVRYTLTFGLRRVAYTEGAV